MTFSGTCTTITHNTHLKLEPLLFNFKAYPPINLKTKSKNGMKQYNETWAHSKHGVMKYNVRSHFCKWNIVLSVLYGSTNSGQSQHLLQWPEYQGYFLLIWINFPAWISNHMLSKVQNEIQSESHVLYKISQQLHLTQLMKEWDSMKSEFKTSFK